MGELFSLQGKVAVVTGALGLIGREHCWALARAGANVVVTDLDQSACDAFADQVVAKELPEAMGVGAEITSDTSLRRLLERVTARFGAIDVLVNNAAINDKF